jgi:hypothetical protein
VGLRVGAFEGAVVGDLVLFSSSFLVGESVPRVGALVLLVGALEVGVMVLIVGAAEVGVVVLTVGALELGLAVLKVGLVVFMVGLVVLNVGLVVLMVGLVVLAASVIRRSNPSRRARAMVSEQKREAYVGRLGVV